MPAISLRSAPDGHDLEDRSRLNQAGQHRRFADNHPQFQSAEKAITNYSVDPTRWAEWTFGAGDSADPAVAERVIRDTFMTDPRAQAKPELFIEVNRASVDL